MALLIIASQEICGTIDNNKLGNMWYVALLIIIISQEICRTIDNIKSGNIGSSDNNMKSESIDTGDNITTQFKKNIIIKVAPN